MKLSEGVEWAMHSCLNLSWVDDEAVTAGKLAAFYQLPTAYMNKQLQALARAGILSSTSGPKGGFRLAKSIADITLLDIVVAIEGPEDIFRCDQVLRHGPGGSDEVDYRQTCIISGAMRKADLAWRTSLADQTIADIRADVEKTYPHTRDATLNHFLNVG